MTGLARFADDPFRALQEIEHRSRQVSGRIGSSVAGARGEWVGLGFRFGRYRFAAPRDEVREVLVCPPLTRVPGAKSWLRGVGNLRGTLLPVTDLAYLTEGRATALRGRTARVIVLRHPSFAAGFLVEEVFGFQQFIADQAVEPPADLPEPCREFVTGAYRQENVWPVISLHALADSPAFQNAADREYLM
ncbi:MAG TPA: chemotaxis protein CheW [Gammaproteobacteria bacterium]|nr:chemotaxis protein CheW [Gammaproteobacteria bacterium]